MTPTDPPMPALDYALVRQQYPAAFAALRKWLINTPIPRDWDMRDGQLRHAESRQRDMFDFFDQQGVVVGIWPGIFEDDPSVFHVSVSGVSQLAIGNNYPTRTAAESAAFIAAFGKLEEMLNQEQG